MKRWLARRLAGFLGRRGYVISRPRFHEEREIDLRAMLASRVESRTGPLSVVQIGANDGVTNDPIQHLVTSRGWSLLAVEPLPGPFAKLVRHYAAFPKVRCVRAAVAAKDGQVDIHTLSPLHGEDETDGQLASLSRDVLFRHWRRVPNLADRIRVEKVRAVTLPTLLTEGGVKTVDLLQVDAEGYDFEILKMAFTAGLRPAILAFEWEHLDPKAMWECRGTLIELGYQWLLVKGDVVAAQEWLFS